jgi:hypothetical protein
MKTKLNSHEILVKSGAANLQKGVETVGGKLYLTTQRLIFEAHKINIQGGVTDIKLSDVNTSKLVWTKFLGLIPLVPNSLAVILKNDKEYRFVLFGRKVWQSIIDEKRMEI